jgi:hypothetical protein
LLWSENAMSLGVFISDTHRCLDIRLPYRSHSHWALIRRHVVAWSCRYFLWIRFVRFERC